MININGDIIGIYDVLNVTTPSNANTTSAQTGASLLKLGYAEYGETNSLDCEIWHPAGLISIPAIPNANTGNQDAAQCLAYKRGDQNIAFAFRDTRTELLAGKINPGETCLYGSNSKAVCIIKDDDSITRITKDSSGNLLMDELSPAGWKLVSSFGSIVLDSTGFHVTHQSGAAFHLGGVTINPVYPTYCNINAASTNAPSLVSLLVSNIVAAATAASAAAVPGDGGKTAFATFITTLSTLTLA